MSKQLRRSGPREGATGRGAVEHTAACATVVAVALRIGFSHAEPFGPSALQKLDSRQAHLEKMLKAEH